MYKSLDSGCYFNECTVIGHYNYFSLHFIAQFHIRVDRIPRMGSKLFKTKGYSLFIVIKVENNNIEFLVELNDFFGVVYSTPGKICDMDQSVNTAKVDKHAI